MAGAAKAKTDIKVIVLGDANVGKTCLLQRYLTGEFAETVTSIGASLALKKWGDWNIALWDTAGEEKYASLSSFYCRGAHVAILAVDLTNKKSFENLQRVFIPLLEEQAPTCMTVVVGTKLDLVKSKGREIGSSEGTSFASSQHQRQLDRALKQNPNSFLSKIQGNESYFETSSKSGAGVTELFQYIERIILIQLQKTGVGSSGSGSSGACVKGGRSGSSKGRPDSVIRLDAPSSSAQQQQSSGGGCCKN